MAILKKKARRIVIDLTGPQGNAYCLLGYAQDFCKQMGKDFAPIKEKMVSGDYENLLKVFDKEFGAVVDLER